MNLTQPNLRIVQEGEVRVIELEARYEQTDPQSAERLRAAVWDAIQANNTRPLILVDMEATEFFTSELVGLLIWARREVLNRQGNIAVCRANRFAQKVLGVVKFDTLCQIYPSREDAVAALSGDSSS